MVPVGVVQVGSVTLVTGAVGGNGCALIPTVFEAGDIQPAALVTVKVYVVPAARDVKVAVVPVPVCVAPPGDAVIVQAPDDGKPLNATLPVAIVQEGCVIFPTIGAVGVAGCVLIAALPDAGDVHPAALVTVKV